MINIAEYDEAVRALKKALEIDENNLQAEELLEKAQAGQKRIEFGKKQIQKDIEQQQQQQEERLPIGRNPKQKPIENLVNKPIEDKPKLETPQKEPANKPV